ncbi:MAG: SDR family oxidoreductase [Solirubrobacteraceae bacterium]
MADGEQSDCIFSPSLLAGGVAIVTGGGSGLGRATALELARCGARVAICGRRAGPLEETVRLASQLSRDAGVDRPRDAGVDRPRDAGVDRPRDAGVDRPRDAGADRPRDAGPAIEAHVCDIREEDDVQRFVDAVLSAHGSIDLLVNNAGGQFLAPAEAITPKGFRTVIRLNVEGTWLMTHAVATKAMIPSGRGGRIVSVTLSPHNGMPGMAHSGAARAAVENLMRTLAVEWARFDIGLVAVAAGQFATQTLLTKYPEAIVRRIAETIPAGRLGSERELATLIAYLCSPAASFLSGTVVTIDGARDDWLGAWPPAAATDERGAPLSEQRRPSGAG